MSKEKETIINEVKVNRPRFYHEAAIAIQFENDNNGPVILKVIAGYNVSEEQFVLVKANKKFRKNFALYDDIEKQAIMFNHGYEYVDTVLQNPACRKPIEILSITPLLKAGSDNKIQYILVSYKLNSTYEVIETDDSVEGNIDTKESEPKTYPEDINPLDVNLNPSSSMQVDNNDTDIKDDINPSIDCNIDIPNDKKAQIISNIKNDKPRYYAYSEKDVTVGIIKISKKVASVEDKPKIITVKVDLLIKHDEDEILVWFTRDEDYINFLEMWNNDDIINRIFFIVDINIISYYDRYRGCWYEPKTLRDPEYVISEVNTIRKCIRLTRPAKKRG